MSARIVRRYPGSTSSHSVAHRILAECRLITPKGTLTPAFSFPV